jgi:hypothetical protein
VAARDPFGELDALRAARRSTAPAHRDAASPPLHEHDDFAGAHAALRNLEVARRELRRPASAEKLAEIHDLWEIAMAHYRQNDVDPVEYGLAADDLVPPPPWWQIKAELLARPEPHHEVVTATDGPAPGPVTNDPPGMKAKPGPEEAFHEPDVLARALVARLSGTIEDAMEASGLNDRDVARVERIYYLHLFRRDGVTLVADPVRVRQRAGRIALRVLSDDGTKWLDPLTVPVPRVSS